jgi:hypothetical protein
MMIPGGLSSEATCKEGRFCVQTEFAHRPRPRVTTTISKDGEVVEKVESKWERSALTEEDKKDIEGFLRRQHQTALRKLREKSRESDSPAEDEGRPAASPEDPVLRVDEELSRMEGVLGWAFLLRDGRTLFQRSLGREDKALIRRVGELSSLLPSVTTAGTFNEGILDSPGRLSLFVPIRDSFLGVKLESEMDPKEVVRKIKALI